MKHIVLSVFMVLVAPAAQAATIQGGNEILKIGFTGFGTFGLGQFGGPSFTDTYGPVAPLPVSGSLTIKPPFAALDDLGPRRAFIDLPQAPWEFEITFLSRTESMSYLASDTLFLLDNGPTPDSPAEARDQLMFGTLDPKNPTGPGLSISLDGIGFLSTGTPQNVALTSTILQTFVDNFNNNPTQRIVSQGLYQEANTVGAQNPIAGYEFAITGLSLEVTSVPVPVPVPAAGVLLLSGLSGLFGLRALIASGRLRLGADKNVLPQPIG